MAGSECRKWNATALTNGRCEQPTESMALPRPRAGTETRAALWPLPLRSLRIDGLFLSPKDSGWYRHITSRAIESKAGRRDPPVSSDRRRTESRCYSLPESGRCLEASCPPHLHKKWGALWRTTLRPRWRIRISHRCAPAGMFEAKSTPRGKRCGFRTPSCMRAGDNCPGPRRKRETGPTNRRPSRNRDRQWSPDRISLRPDTLRPPKFHPAVVLGRIGSMQRAIGNVRAVACQDSGRHSTACRCRGVENAHRESRSGGIDRQ